MDREKVALLFGELPDGADPDQPDGRAALLAEQDHIHDDELLGPGRSIALEHVARQVAESEPPQVWQTAQRLLAVGLNRQQVLQQLVVALHESLETVSDTDAEFDTDAYLARLAQLPLPGGDDIATTIIEVLRAHQPVPCDELNGLVVEQLGVPQDDPLIVMLLDRVTDRFLTDSESPVTILTGDVVVHVESFTAGIVLTHRLSDAERDSDILDIGADLAVFQRYRKLRLPDGDELVSAPDATRCLAGPLGWLDDLPAEAHLTVRIDDDGTVRISAIDQPPALSDERVELLRAVYDDTVAEPWLPVDAEELVLGMLVRQPQAFAEPTAPIVELAQAAGLERRENHFAHEESVWESQRRMHRDWRVLQKLGRPGERDWTAVQVLSLLDDAPPLDAVSAREVLAGLYDLDVLKIVPDELLGTDDDPELLAHTAAVSERLLAIASTPPELAVAHWLAALVAERRGDVFDAESHLRVAVRADPGWWSATDRLAWYQSDRGDAAAALKLWRQAGFTTESRDEIRVVASFVAAPAPKLGRNEPCWCGSGRKYKACHLGRLILAPLPDRVEWLCRKAIGYLIRRQGAAMEAVIEHTMARVVDPDDPESIHQALDDPLVFDVLLHEGGWFERFLSDRGPLLPDDEAVLARTWTQVARTGYEVLQVRPGDAATVRDLRTGELIEVRERSLPGPAQAGVLLCGRAVPDGTSHQLIPGVFTVPPDHEHTLFDLLDKRDGIALLNYVVELHRSPDQLDADHK